MSQTLNLLHLRGALYSHEHLLFKILFLALLCIQPLLPPICPLFPLWMTHFSQARGRTSLKYLHAFYSHQPLSVLPLLALQQLRPHIWDKGFPNSHVEKPLIKDQDTYKHHKAKLKTLDICRRCRYCGWKIPNAFTGVGGGETIGDSLPTGFVMKSTGAVRLYFNSSDIKFPFYIK